MRVFTLHRGLTLNIGDDIAIRAEVLSGSKVKLYITCPQDLRTETKRREEGPPPCSIAHPKT